LSYLPLVLNLLSFRELLACNKFYNYNALISPFYHTNTRTHTHKHAYTGTYTQREYITYNLQGLLESFPRISHCLVPMVICDILSLTDCCYSYITSQICIIFFPYILKKEIHSFHHDLTSLQSLFMCFKEFMSTLYCLQEL
jgi:hypothetical protein